MHMMLLIDFVVAISVLILLIHTYGLSYTDPLLIEMLTFLAVYADSLIFASSYNNFLLNYLETRASYMYMTQVIQSWYVMGRLGAFNTANLQVHPFCRLTFPIAKFVQYVP